jgi:hypothetical protein
VDEAMNRQAPAQLDQIGLLPHLFKFSDERSWRGPCPVCGGHRRFVIFTDHEWPMWNGFCDECGHTIKAWERVTTPITDEQRQFARERAAAFDNIREQAKREALARFTTAELWQELHRRLSAEHRAQWEAWGVPDEWQDYLELGFTPDKMYRDSNGDTRHTPAYTIPYFHYTADKPQFKTLQYRLFNPERPEDRYRFEHGLSASYYMTTPTDPIGDQVIICEGAKKGIVTRVSLTDYTVLAVPAKGTWGGIAEAVKPCGRVWVLLDPDATQNAVKLVRTIGPNARIVRMPTKIDDAALFHGLERSTFSSILKQAWRI